MSKETKSCPFCGEEVLAIAKKCRYCEEYFDPADRPRSAPDAVERMLVPSGRPASAIAAGYMGLLALFPAVGLVFGILGIVFGIIALKTISRDRALSGKGRAWFGIICGGLMALLWGLALVGLLIELLTRNKPHYG
jgi:hypothetical protein